MNRNLNQNETKIARGVADRDTEFFYRKLELLIKTLKAASFKHRLIYLLTGRIPPTKSMQSAEGANYTVDSYEAWLRY